MSEIQFTEQDCILFHQIACDIKSNPDKYHEAGKWLDDYCKKEQFRKRIKDRIKICSKIEGGYPAAEEIDALEYMLEEDFFISPEALTLYPEEDKRKIWFLKSEGEEQLPHAWEDAVLFLLRNWHRVPHLGEESAKKILLMTWILTDPETDSLKSNITGFQQRPWDERSYLSVRTYSSNQKRLDQWMKAVKLAWRIINSKDTIPLQSQAKHSIDFRSVHWFGTDYSFTANQAAAVKILWQAWENGTPDIGGDTLAAEIDSESKRAQDIFKNHPAYGKMIRSGQSKGSYRLAAPNK